MHYDNPRNFKKNKNDSKKGHYYKVGNDKSYPKGQKKRYNKYEDHTYTY